MATTVATRERYFDPEQVRAALELLDDLPFPALWIRSDREVLWSNAAARRLGHGGGKCHHVCYGSDAPCSLLPGTPCPKDAAEHGGHAVAVLHAVPARGGAVQHHHIYAVPLSAGGVLELHLPQPADASLDAVTGRLTRRAFEEAAAALLASAAAAHHDAAVLLVDAAELDLLARNHGNSARENLLRWLGELVSGLLPAGALTGMWLGNCYVSLCIPQQPPRVDPIAAALRGLLAGEVCGSRRAAALIRLGLWQGRADCGIRHAVEEAEKNMIRLLDTRAQPRDGRGVAAAPSGAA